MLTAGQVTFVNRCSTLRPYPYGMAYSMMMTGMSDKKPCMFSVLPSIIVRFLFCVCVSTHSRTGDHHHRMFDTDTVSVWRSMLHDDDWHVRQEALNVLGLALYHSMLLLLCWCCAHRGSGELHQQIFDTDTIYLWRRMLQDDDWPVRQEALIVLGRTISHSMLLFFRVCFCSQWDR